MQNIATGQEIRAWRGHDLPILDMCYDSTGTLIATASTDRTVRVWNAEKSFCTHSFRGHSSLISRVYFHPRPDRLVRAFSRSIFHFCLRLKGRDGAGWSSEERIPGRFTVVEWLVRGESCVISYCQRTNDVANIRTIWMSMCVLCVRTCKDIIISR